MEHSNTSLNAELPSMRKLIISTIIAIGIAAVILVTIVLPAEYGIDPTGVGRMMGLTKMGDIKVSLAQEVASDQSINNKEPVSPDYTQAVSEPVPGAQSSESEVDYRSDTMVITLEPNEGKEIKLTMTKGTQIDYVWFTDGGAANFDAHADSKELQISYHNYNKGTLERSVGVLEAAFDGNHGWFWRNRTSETMKVTLQVKGDYSDIDLKP